MRICVIAVMIACPGLGQTAFQSAVEPVLGTTCKMCHNDRNASGGLNISPFLVPTSLSEQREGWEKIVRKIRSGEMPPQGIPRPPAAKVEALLNYVDGELAKADLNSKPDPGHLVAHRLNRREYTNTIRDLLGVDFRAERDFPTDDSGYGFDNIGTVLTISPVLMEKYMNAAEAIAARAIGADPLPKKPIQIEYSAKNKTIRRPDFSTIEATHFVEWDAEYVLHIGLPGERSGNASPVSMGIWMDGKLLTTKTVEMKPSKLVYFEPYSEEQARLYLPAGDHVFRIGLISDDFVQDLTPKDAYNRKKNKFIDSVVFEGPYASSVERPSRKKILICDPNSGTACVERILTTLAHRAYRRPVEPTEVASLMKFVSMAKAAHQTAEQGIQLAIEAMLVSPKFLFRIERDPDAAVHNVSDVELASRLSYFLWSSMPDDELLGLAESGKLHESGVLHAQVKRMLDDPRSTALAQNFAGQWLEIRNLDFVKPDPQKFPQWGPELKEAMRSETTLFFESVLRENRPISDFLDGRYTFLNERLAKFYGIDGVRGPDFRRVDLTTEQRGGLLSQASVLTVSSYPTRTSVVIRGKYLLENFLGSPVPPPPPDVPPLDEAAVGTAASLRQQMEKHRADAACASCHNKMDPLGFGLENYDGIGHWRSMDGKFPVDASGTLPNGKSFGTPAEMRALLMAQLPEFSRCLSEKMLTYALGRGLDPADSRTVAQLNRDMAASEYRFQSLIYGIADSVPFRMGRRETNISKTNIMVTKESARR